MNREKIHIFFDFGLNDRSFLKLKKESKKYDKSVIISERETLIDSVLNVDSTLDSKDFASELVQASSDFNEQFKEIEKLNDFRSDYLRSSKVKLFEHNISAVIKWIYALKILEKEYGHKNICCVLPMGVGSNQIALLEAEGEVSTFRKAKLLYRKSDFLPNYVQQFCTQNGFETKFFNYYSLFFWLPVGRVWRKFLRIYGHITFRIFLVIARNMFRSNDVKYENTGASVIAVSRATAHSEFLAPLVNREKTFCLIQESLISNGQVMNASQIMFSKDKYANIYDYVSALDFFICVIICIKDLIKTILYNIFAPRSIKINSIEISLNLVAVEAVAMKFEFLILERALKNFNSLNPSIKTLVHCDLNSEISTFFEQSIVCKPFNIFQLAFGSYVVRALPDFVRGTEFLCFSVNQKENLSRMATKPDKVCYRGNMYVGSKSCDIIDLQKRITKRKPCLAYCTQPYGKEEEKKLIFLLQKLSHELKFDLVIIYHPRDNISEFPGKPQEHVRIINNIDYVANKDQFDSEFCFAIMRHSNIGLRFLLQGIPVINLLLAKADKLVEQDYFDGYPLLFDNIDSFRYALINAEKTIEKFFMFREQFLSKEYPGGDICNYIESYDFNKNIC